MKFANLVKIRLWPHLAVKGLTQQVTRESDLLRIETSAEIPH